MHGKGDLGSFVRQGGTSGLRYERRYDRSVETVWKALTEPARLADWMGLARVEPYVGGRYELFVNTPDPMLGKVVTWQPPELLEFSCSGRGAPASLVRCELVREGAGTRLIFMHRAIRFATSCLTLGVWRMNYLKQQKSPYRQAANFWLVLLLHAGLGYLVVTSLGHSVVEVMRGPMAAEILPDIKLPDSPPVLLPPPRLLPPLPSMPLPDIQVKTPWQSPIHTEPSKPAAEEPPARKAEPVPAVHVAPVIDAARACRKPDYPSISIRLGEEGPVDLEFLVDLDGRVTESRIANSSGHNRLDEAARNTLATCRFTPGTVDGKPEKGWAHLRYIWKLDQ